MVLDAIDNHDLIEVTMKDGQTRHGTPINHDSKDGRITFEEADAKTFKVVLGNIDGVEVIDA